MLKAILNKGGAGKSITRSETVDRLSVLLRMYNEIMFAYDGAIPFAENAEEELKLEANAHEIRDDLAKLSELILSNGGVPPLGAGKTPSGVALGLTRSEVFAAVTAQERAFADALKAESSVRHMLRTVATLDTTHEAVLERITVLSDLGKRP